jgi:hypothetical protein
LKPKDRFALFIAQGHAKDPRTGAFRTAYEVSRILDIHEATLRGWIFKDHPEWAEVMRARGPKTKAETTAKKEAVVALLSSGGHLSPGGRLIPCYLLADRIGVSPNTLMKWTSEIATDVAALWKRGHCNPFNPDDPSIEETRENQRASVRKHRQYARRVNTRRVNKLKRELLS